MTNASPSPQPKTANPERWQRLVIFLILVNTVFTALVAGLETDASIRASQANRYSQFYSVSVSSELLRAQVQSSYDLSTYSDALLTLQRADILEYTALERQLAGDERGYQDLMIDSEADHARANRAKALCIFYTIPKYAPSDDFGSPDTQAYLDDIHAVSYQLLDEQNAASDRYHRWNSKADSYVTLLTVMAISFFLLGIAQMVRPGLRLLFAVFATFIMAISLVWTLSLLVF